MKKWVARMALGLVGLVVLALVIGASVEANARGRARRDFPPPGKMVDVDNGRRIQMDCRGTGTPTVVLESGLDTYGSLSWSAVHDSIAKTTRTCAYSRAGVMWSDAASGPFDANIEASDLHTALTKSGEIAPWVMVGHSLGGPYVMNFTNHYGSEVAGIVFVDASHPDQIDRMWKATGVSPAASMRIPSMLAAMSWTGITRVLPLGGAPAEWPAVMRTAPPAYMSTSLGGAIREASALPATFATAGHLRTLGDRPLVVLTATKQMPDATLKAQKMTKEQGAKMQAAWKDLHNDEASWSTRSRHELVPDATHY
ncbi:MAG: alpha/beta hydrolase, partial [Gemmatimonadota bacterium]|nr:alpha/beta hydrolase [Gemmatimonadota bacterium]